MNQSESKGISRVKKILSQFYQVRELSLLLIIITSSIVIYILRPVFLSRANLAATAMGFSAEGFIVMGMTVALISRGFDLSVGGVMASTAIVCGYLYNSGINIWVAAIISIAIGVSFGVINGLLIGKIGLNTFIATLATLSISRGLAYVLSEGSFVWIGGGELGRFSTLGGGFIFGIPLMIIYLIVFAIILDFLSRRSETVRKVFYLGDNENAAVLAGINVFKVKMGVFIFSAFLASVSGVLTLSRFQTATPVMGTGVALRAVSAAIIGGTTLRGGEGSIIGGILGIILISIINNAMVLFAVPIYWQELVNGLVLLIAVTVDFYANRRRESMVKL